MNAGENGSGRRVGYARVSTKDQRLSLQLDALNQAGCTPIFEDHGVSGAKGSRPGLDAMLDDVKAGDMVVVYKLDRLGRSVLHLSDLLVRFQEDGIHFMSLSEGINTATPGGKLVFHLFSAFAEFQRDIILENTLCGLEAAKKRGTRLGRRPILSPQAVVEAHRLIAAGERRNDIADMLGVSRITLDRAIRRMGLDHAA
ncbi:recombinase family protein [Stappia stellulata]|uniref:recombinase family protein n=1 Tax=Stappia stellulata TaxID=71235 RepID=UPI00041560DD|nr:recombinase family protein [Stappia stellulata]